MTCVISWGHCSLIGLLVVMSVVVVCILILSTTFVCRISLSKKK